MTLPDAPHVDDHDPPRIGVDEIRRALRRWHDPSLGRSEVASRLTVVRDRVAASGRFDTPVQRADATRALFRDVLDRMRAVGYGALADVLHRRYVQRDAVMAIARDLAIGERAFFSRQNEAVRVFAEIALAFESEARAAVGAAAEARLAPETPPRDPAAPGVSSSPPAVPHASTDDGRRARRGHPPRPLTSLVGRRRELPEVTRLAAVTRLVTVTGPGGGGKTRLAQAVADRLEGEAAFASGIVWVDLSPLPAGGDVAQAVAEGLGVPDIPKSSRAASIGAGIGRDAVLVVLDNCEHVLAASAALARRLLADCPGLHILATSRVPLGVPGEHVYPLAPLALPQAGTPAGAPEVIQSEAVDLFVQRAQAVRPDFRLTTPDAEATVDLCRRLDGLPLAIELAAARLNVLSTREIAERLDDRFRLLTRGSASPLPHHRTLLAAVEWSTHLLPEDDRALFCRLAVFVGGFTLEAAAAIGWPGRGAEVDILDSLSNLVDASLVVSAPARESAVRRFGMLETLQRYGRDRLAESDEEAAVRDRHLDYYLDLAEAARPNLRGADHADWTARLADEHDNARAALAWAVARGETDRALRLAGALAGFWERMGYFELGRASLQQALNLPRAPGDLAARALAESGAGSLAEEQGDYAAAEAHFAASLDAARALGDRPGIAEALNNLGNVADFRGAYDAARGLYAESLALRRALGDRRDIASTLNNLGSVAYNQGDYASAALVFEECLAIFRSLGDPWLVAIALNNLGLAAADAGDMAAARPRLEESLEIARAIGDPQGVAYALQNLGDVALRQRDLAAARELHAECLALRHKLGDKQGTAASLESFATLAHADGDAAHAARLLGAAVALRAAIGAPRSANEHEEQAAEIEALRRELGATAFDSAWTAGEGADVEAVVASALGSGAGGGSLDAGRDAGRRTRRSAATTD